MHHMRTRDLGGKFSSKWSKRIAGKARESLHVARKLSSLTTPSIRPITQRAKQVTLGVASGTQWIGWCSQEPQEPGSKRLKPQHRGKQCSNHVITDKSNTAKLHRFDLKHVVARLHQLRFPQFLCISVHVKSRNGCHVVFIDGCPPQSSTKQWLNILN